MNEEFDTAQHSIPPDPQPAQQVAPQAPQQHVPQVPQAPQMAAFPAAPRRSPGLALVLSFFPGLGHLYLGLYQRGIGVFLAFAASIWFADHSDLGILVPFVWFFAVIDAYRQAHLLNAAQAAGTAPAEMAAVPAAPRGGSLGFGVFLTALGLILLYNQFYPIDFTFIIDWWPLILVGFGVYIIGRYAYDQKRQREQAKVDDDSEWQPQS